MAEDDKRVTLPSTTEEVRAVTHIPTTEATRSFAKYVNENLANADNFEPISDEQAWVIVGCHRPWQQSPERKAEKEALKEERSKENEAKKAEREERKAQREAERAEKKAERERKKAEKEAAKAAEEDLSDDLDSVDAEGDGEISAPKKRRRPRPKPVAETEETEETPEPSEDAESAVL